MRHWKQWTRLASILLIANLLFLSACVDDPGAEGQTDAAFADAADGGAAPTTCTPNLRFCWEGVTWEVWSCSATGKPTSKYTTCDVGESCETVDGVAACVQAPSNDVESGDADSSDSSDSGQQSPKSCVDNMDFCFNGDVWGCVPQGSPAGLLETCSPGAVCVINTGVGACVTPQGDAGVSDVSVADASSADAGISDGGATTDAQTNDTSPPKSCIKNTSFCYQNAVWLCGATGLPAGKLKTCKQVEVCAPFAGGAMCMIPKPDAGVTDAGVSDAGVTDAGAPDAGGPKSCVKNTSFCYQNAVWLCGPTGLPAGKLKTCKQVEVCAPFAGGAMCMIPKPDAGVTDAGVSDAGVTDAGAPDAGGPKSCVKNTSFCYQNAVWLCGATGLPSGKLKTCKQAEVCTPFAGGVMCMIPKPDAGVTDTGISDAGVTDAGAPDAGGPKSCVKNTSFCYQNAVWLCGATGLPSGKLKTCKQAEVCTPFAGGVMCMIPKPDAGVTDTGISDAGVTDAGAPDAGGPKSCVKNTSFCYQNAVWLCGATGLPIGKLKTCKQTEVCTPFAGSVMCMVPKPDAGVTDTGVSDAGVTDASVSDAGVTDTGVMDVGADSNTSDAGTPPKTCVKGKTFCDGATIRYCKSNGTWGSVKTTCKTGFTCGIQGGAAVCVAGTPPKTCVKGKTFCDGATIRYCKSNGTWGSVKTTCKTGFTCGIQGGAAVCVAGTPPKTCVKGKTFCDGATIRYCKSNGTWGSVKTTCKTGFVCGVEGGAAVCVAGTPPKTCVKGKTFCDGATIRYCKSNGTWGSVKTTCKTGFVCGVEGGAAVCIAGKLDCSVSPCMCIPSVQDSCVSKTDSSVSFAKVYSTKKKTDCFKPAETQACPKGNSCVAGVCTSSVADPKSLYYNDSCDLEKHLAAKTKLEADCRCFYNQGIKNGVPICYRPFDAFKAGKSVSTGPSLGGLSTVSIAGGTYDAGGDELIWAVSWGSSTARTGLLLGVDVKSGARRIISGAYKDNSKLSTTGSGPGFTWPTEVRFAPGGKLYVLNNTAAAKPEVISVDMKTGKRTLVWRGADKNFGQCASPTPGKSVQYTSGGFAVDGDGSFLIGFANPVSDGRGVARISANAKSCAVVTATGSAGGKINKGAGGALGGFVQGFAIHAGKIHALTTQPKTLWQIDPKTGNRVALAGGGTGTSLGERHVAWDAKRKLFWIAGIKDSVTVYAFDPVTKKLTYAQKDCGPNSFIKVCWAGPININTLNYGGMVVHPTNGRLYFGQDTMAVVEVEPETGNSVLLSL